MAQGAPDRLSDLDVAQLERVFEHLSHLEAWRQARDVDLTDPAVRALLRDHVDTLRYEIPDDEAVLRVSRALDRALRAETSGGPTNSGAGVPPIGPPVSLPTVGAIAKASRLRRSSPRRRRRCSSTARRASAVVWTSGRSSAR